MPSSNHSAKDDMIEGITMNNEKEATDNIMDKQNIENDDHETIGSYEKTNGESESSISKRDSTQIYLDDIAVYEDENDEHKEDINLKGHALLTKVFSLSFPVHLWQNHLRDIF